MSLLDSLKNLLSKEASNTVSNLKSNARSQIAKAADNAQKAVSKAIATKTKTFRFDSIPASVDELKALPESDMKDPFASVAIIILALNMYYRDKDAGIAAFDYCMGPGELSNLEISRIDMSIQQNGTKVPLSYFEGADPDNNYTPKEPLTIKVYEFSTSKDNYGEGYIRLFVRSGGADSERQVTLRNKPSTKQWFAHEFSALYMGIKIAKEDNAWA